MFHHDVVANMEEVLDIPLHKKAIYYLMRRRSVRINLKRKISRKRFVRNVLKSMVFASCFVP